MSLGGFIVNLLLDLCAAGFVRELGKSAARSALAAQFNKELPRVIGMQSTAQPAIHLSRKDSVDSGELGRFHSPSV